MNKRLLIGLIAGVLTLGLGGGIAVAALSHHNDKEEQVEEVFEDFEEETADEDNEPLPAPVEEPLETEAPAEDENPWNLTPEMAQAYLDAIYDHGQKYDKFALINIDANGIPQLCMLHESFEVSVYSVDENGNLIDFGKDDLAGDEQGVFGLGTFSRYIYSMNGSGKIVSSQTGTGGAGRWYEIYSLGQNGINLIWMGGYDALVDDNGNFAEDENGDLVFDDPFVGRMQVPMEEFEQELNTYLPEGDEEIALSEDAGNYKSRQEMIEYLESVASAASTGAKSSDDNWKKSYKSYLYDVMADAEYLPDWYEAITYSDNGGAYFALKDITGDGIPELWISASHDPLTYGSWGIYTVDDSGRTNCIHVSDELVFCYDEKENKLYGHMGGVDEHYTVYSIENGQAEYRYTLSEPDVSPSVYLKGNEEISAEQMAEYDRELEQAKEKFRSEITPIVLDKEHIEKELQ